MASDLHTRTLAELIHWRHATRAKMHVQKHDHWLGVSIKVREKLLVAVVNAHLPRGMGKEMRNQACAQLGTFLQDARTRI